jgi:hypothetical protein
MRFRHSKKVIFQAITHEVAATQTPPISASQCVPDWYKKLPKYVNNSHKPIKALGKKDLKTCAPFLDALIGGYMVRLIADVEVTIDANGDVDVFSNQVLPILVVDKRGPLDEHHQGFGMPHPAGTVPIMFAWVASWGIATDKTDSILYTHPLNRFDLPFVTTSGIVDTGYNGNAGNIPFFIKEGFTGIIPKGTPIIQAIPFKRENWISKQKDPDLEGYRRIMINRDSYLEGFYKMFGRQPKSYK